MLLVAMSLKVIALHHFIVSICLLAGHVAAQDDRPYNSTDYFIHPPRSGPKIETSPVVWRENPEYHVDEEMNLEWETSRSIVSIVLYRDTTDQSQYITRAYFPPSIMKASSLIWNLEEAPMKTFSWSGVLDSSSITLDERKGRNVFFFVAYDSAEETGGDYYFYSHYFNLTRSTAATSGITAAGAATTTASSLEVSSHSRTTSLSSLTTVVSLPSDTHNGSHAAVIGGGIGGGIGGALLILGVIFLVWRHQKKQRQHAAVVGGALSDPYVQKQMGQQDLKPELDSFKPSSGHPSNAGSHIFGDGTSNSTVSQPYIVQRQELA
jgi:hypothetical protein